MGDNHAASPDVTPEVVEYVMMEGNRDKADNHGHDKTFQTLQKKVIYPEGFGLGECWHRAISHFWHCPEGGRIPPLLSRALRSPNAGGLD
jgi:hypothetical protein